jgi:hypothetical protein
MRECEARRACCLKAAQRVFHAPGRVEIVRSSRIATFGCQQSAPVLSVTTRCSLAYAVPTVSAVALLPPTYRFFFEPGGESASPAP